MASSKLAYIILVTQVTLFSCVQTNEGNVMERPLLKQLGSVTLADFEKFPVWVLCHTTDYDEEWYDDTDEATVRPWSDNIPIDAKSAIFFIRAHFVLADGAEMKGFVSYMTNPQWKIVANDIGSTQPVLLHPSGKQIPFWYGVIKITSEDMNRIYTLLGKDRKMVFPIRYRVDDNLIVVEQKGEIDGFYSYRQVDSGAVVVYQ